MTNQKDSATLSLKPLTGSRVLWKKVDLYVLLQQKVLSTAHRPSRVSLVE